MNPQQPATSTEFDQDITQAAKVPTQKVVDWLIEEVNQREQTVLNYGKHDAYSKSDYSKSFGQYSKS
jgi:hypothetical protein